MLCNCGTQLIYMNLTTEITYFAFFTHCWNHFKLSGFATVLLTMTALPQTMLLTATSIFFPLTVYYHQQIPQ
jgi:hypothetical protein